MPNWMPRDALAAEAMAGLVADTMPDLCETCGGFKANDSMPGWVFKEREICDCQHLHQWDKAEHYEWTISRSSVVQRTKVSQGIDVHDCELCSICGGYRCEAE